MKLKRFLLPILAWSGLVLTSCLCEHEEVTGYLSSLQVGNVVCSDGNILSMDRFKQSEKVPVAIVFHVNRSAETDNLGYAVTFMISNAWLCLTVSALIRVLLHH